MVEIQFMLSFWVKSLGAKCSSSVLSTKFEMALCSIMIALNGVNLSWLLLAFWFYGLGLDFFYSYKNLFLKKCAVSDNSNCIGEQCDRTNFKHCLFFLSADGHLSRANIDTVVNIYNIVTKFLSAFLDHVSKEFAYLDGILIYLCADSVQFIYIAISFVNIFSKKTPEQPGSGICIKTVEKLAFFLTNEFCSLETSVGQNTR